MKKLFLFFLAPLCSFSPPYQCGGSYRWDYKILIDSVGANVVYNKKPVSKSVHALVSIPRPANAQLGNRRSVPEQQKIKTTAYIIGLGEEDNDNDYHLILESLDGKDSLIAEIPDPGCEKLKGFPQLKKDYRAARKFIDDEIDASPGNVYYLAEKVKVRITGVVFFDKKGHGHGHAGNGVEIHPVLKIERAD